MRRVWLIGAVVALVAAGVVVWRLVGDDVTSRLRADSCTATVQGRTVELQPEQAENAALIAAVSVRRGSSTTIRPPRACSSRTRAGKSGTVISEPFDAIGLAPITRKYDVRSRSGIGSSSWWP